MRATRRSGCCGTCSAGATTSTGARRPRVGGPETGPGGGGAGAGVGSNRPGGRGAGPAGGGPGRGGGARNAAPRGAGGGGGLSPAALSPPSDARYRVIVSNPPYVSS